MPEQPLQPSSETCPNCGMRWPPKAIVCPNCGTFRPDSPPGAGPPGNRSSRPLLVGISLTCLVALLIGLGVVVVAVIVVGQMLTGCLKASN